MGVVLANAPRIPPATCGKLVSGRTESWISRCQDLGRGCGNYGRWGQERGKCGLSLRDAGVGGPDAEGFWALRVVQLAYECPGGGASRLTLNLALPRLFGAALRF